MIKATSTDLNATFLIIFRSALSIIDKNMGVLPIGFKIAKKPIKTVVKNNVRFGIEFILLILYDPTKVIFKKHSTGKLILWFRVF